MDPIRPPVMNPTVRDDEADDVDRDDGSLTPRERQLPEHEIDRDSEQTLGGGQTQAGGTTSERPSGSGTATGTLRGDASGGDDPLVSGDLDRDEVMPPPSTHE